MVAEVLVVGSFIHDEITYVTRFPNKGETIIANDFREALGGKGINQAISCAKLGTCVKMAGILGDDRSGQLFKNAMTVTKTDFQLVKTTKKYPTGKGIIQVNNRGENKIAVVLGANQMDDLIIDGAFIEALKETSIVVCQLELRQYFVEKVINLCHQYDKPIVLNPAPATKLSPKLLAKVDYLTPNEHELEQLVGFQIKNDLQRKQACTKLIDSGVKHLVVTLGEKGVYYQDAMQSLSIPGLKVETIDTIGAGDTFNGALAFAIVKKMNIESALRLANSAAAFSTMSPGGFESAPTLMELEKFMEEQHVSV